MGDIEIQQILFDPTGLVIAYQDLDDIRVGGAVIQQKTVRLDVGHPDYAEDADGLHRKAVKLLRNALEDFESSEPHRFEQEPGDDDGPGMGE